MKKVAVFLTICILGALLAGCSLWQTEDNKILGVVKSNISAFNKKDLDAYMKTIYAPNENQVRNSMKIAFNTYTLNVKLSNLKVIKKTPEEAVVSCIQTTKKIKGPDFKNSKSNTTYYLKKINGEWKITKTEADNVEYSR